LFADLFDKLVDLPPARRRFHCLRLAPGVVRLAPQLEPISRARQHQSAMQAAQTPVTNPPAQSARLPKEKTSRGSKWRRLYRPRLERSAEAVRVMQGSMRGEKVGGEPKRYYACGEASQAALALRKAC
jgi:hypothetical protein